MESTEYPKTYWRITNEAGERFFPEGDDKITDLNEQIGAYLLNQPSELDQTADDNYLMEYLTVERVTQPAPGGIEGTRNGFTPNFVVFFKNEEFDRIEYGDRIFTRTKKG